MGVAAPEAERQLAARLAVGLVRAEPLTALRLAALVAVVVRQGLLAQAGVPVVARTADLAVGSDSPSVYPTISYHATISLLRRRRARFVGWLGVRSSRHSNHCFALMLL